MLFVALVYVHYPVSIGGYFRAAFRRNAEVTVVSAGPSAGNWIQWNGGMTLPYADEPDIALPPGPATIEQLEREIEARYGQAPDAYVQIGGPYHVGGRPRHGKNLFIATDAHVVDYETQRSLADHFFNMHRQYSRPGDIWLPYCADPVHNAPLELLEPEYDVCLIGAFYPNRQRIASRLHAEGMRVHLVNGPCFGDAREIYAKTCIGWNDPLHDDLNMRSFELKHMGLPVVERWVPDLDAFFGAEETLAYRSDDECVDYCKSLLGDPAKRKLLAANGQRAARGHTYDERVSQILSYL